MDDHSASHPYLHRLRDLFWAVLVGLGLAACWHVTMDLLGHGWPFNTFLFYPEDRFNDWNNTVFASRNLDPYHAAGPAIAPYFPTAYLMVWPFSLLPKSASVSCYLAMALSGIALAARAMWLRVTERSLRKTKIARQCYRYAAGTLLLSYPFLFAIDRGNLDVLIAALCTVLVATIGTSAAFWGSAVLGVAIAMKGYPLAFSLLLLKRPTLHHFLMCGLIAALLTAGSIWVTGHGLMAGVVDLLAGFEAYKDAYVLNTGSLFASSDPYNGIRTVILASTYASGAPLSQVEFIALSQRLLSQYIYLSAAVAGLLASLILFTGASFQRKVWAACLICLFFPAVANDYRLTILFPAVLLSALTREDGARYQTILLSGAVLMMIPKSYVFPAELCLTNVINPLILTSLLVVVVCGPFFGLIKSDQSA